jgi:hypothetical protein
MFALTYCNNINGLKFPFVLFHRLRCSASSTLRRVECLFKKRLFSGLLDLAELVAATYINVMDEHFAVAWISF